MLPELTEETAGEFIRRRRRQIVVHSCIYYRLDKNIISDHQWATWAQELVAAQKQFPQIAEKEIWAKEFEDFDGSTGFNLPITEPRVLATAEWLLRLQEKRKG